MGPGPVEQQSGSGLHTTLTAYKTLKHAARAAWACCHAPAAGCMAGDDRQDRAPSDGCRRRDAGEVWLCGSAYAGSGASMQDSRQCPMLGTVMAPYESSSLSAFLDMARCQWGQRRWCCTHRTAYAEVEWA